MSKTYCDKRQTSKLFTSPVKLLNLGTLRNKSIILTTLT